MTTELRQVRTSDTHIQSGERFLVQIRYRLDEGEPVIRIKPSAGFEVTPSEVAVNPAYTDTRVTLTVCLLDPDNAPTPSETEDEHLCVLTFSLGAGAVMDTNLWVRR